MTAENVEAKWGVRREEQGALDVDSQRRAFRAAAGGYFKEQMLPVEVNSRKGSTVIDHDEHIRTDASLESMAKLRSIFKENGTVTAGNASSMNDAASAVGVLCCSRCGRRR